MRNFLRLDAVKLPRAAFKRIMLTGYLAILCIVIAGLYAWLDFSHAVLYSLPFYLLLATGAALSLILIRQRKFVASKVVVITVANLVIFLSALNDPPSTGTYMLFITTGTGAFAIFRFQERRIAMRMMMLSTALFLIASLGNFHFPHVHIPTTYILLSFVANFLISLSVTVAMLYFLGNLNELSENELVKKEKIARERNRQLVKINAELDRFIYSVSHDLKSPLSSIEGLVMLAKRSPDPDEIQKCLTLINDCVKAQEFFIQEIIEIYRNDRAAMMPQSIHLQALVEEVIHEISGIQNIRFVVDFPGVVWIVADKLRLKSVLHNLVGNAIKYHDMNKSDRYVRIGASARDGEVTISINDNGIGIAAEHLPKIFDMFYRASEDSKGSGLGLYIVKEIVARMNGQIKAASILHSGTAFTITLPASWVAKATATADEAA